MSNGHVCKHIRAVQQKLDTQSTKWTDYNLYQTTEGSTLTSYLKEPVSSLDEVNPNGRGRPHAPLSDEVFWAAMKAYTNQSTRRVQSVINRAEDDNLIDPAHHFNTVTRFLNREDVTPILHELVWLSAAPLAQIEHAFAVDSSGFRTSQFGEWCDTKHSERVKTTNGKTMTVKREYKWIKCHISPGVESNIIADVIITPSEGENTADTNFFIPLIDGTTGYFDVHEVSADKGYLSKRKLCRRRQDWCGCLHSLQEELKVNPLQTVEWCFRNLLSKSDDWLKHYHLRSNVESTFGVVKENSAIMSGQRTILLRLMNCSARFLLKILWIYII